MYDRILFPTDGSEAASAVLEYVLDVAASHGATLHVLNVADTTEVSATRIRTEVIDVLEGEGKRIVEDAADRVRDRGVPVETDVLQGRPSATIVDYADTYDVDLVVMATHGRKGIERFLLGSVTERVVTESPVPVVTATPSEGDAFTYPPAEILVPTDGSEGANRAVREAVELARAAGATLHLLHVVETASLGVDVRSAIASDELDDRATEILEDAREMAAASSLEDVTTTVAYGRPIREILSQLEENDIDMVAVGTHGETNFSRRVLGGVTAKLIRTSPVPVVSVREADDGQ